MNNEQLLERLLGIVARLYSETDGFEQHSEDGQLWYNRGYANGMLAGLVDLGHGEAIRTAGISPDPQDMVADQALLPWGQAYSHGFEMGQRETREVLGGG